jgi:hypothetical protein
MDQQNASTASRRFAAQTPLRQATVLKIAAIGMVLPLGLAVAVATLPRYVTVEALMFFVASFVVGGLLWWWSMRQRLIFTVTSDGLAIDKRPGEVFPFGDAQLGPWIHPGPGGTTKGTAIHLRSGPHRFVLGGRPRQSAPGTGSTHRP